MQAAVLINVRFSLPERPCYSLPALTHRPDQCCFFLLLSGPVKEEQAAWVCPAACIHPPEVNRTGSGETIQLGKRWAADTVFLTGGLSRPVSHLDNVTWWQRNSNNDMRTTLGRAVSLACSLLISLRMIFTCLGCHFGSPRPFVHFHLTVCRILQYYN